MNFTVFHSQSTNIWPLANDSKNGQLLSEYNLRCRESVITDSNVSYFIGPSYVHSMSDFLVRIQTDGAGSVISSSTLEILPGRCLLNGHYVQSLVPIQIDLLEANKQAQLDGTPPLKGNLSIGLRAMYSSEVTMAGSMKSYDKSEIYQGVQVVILPKDEFITPIDSPTQNDKITAHIKLADFSFLNGAIANVKVNENKLAFIGANRLYNVSSLISDTYITKQGLNPKKLYTFAGKGTDPETGLDTWCESTDALMVWDHTPKLTTDKPSGNEANFNVDLSGKVQLEVPHKQVDGMTDTSGKSQYYENKYLKLPVADYMRGSSGTVDVKYTNHVKAISEKLQSIYKLPNGKQIGYIEVLDDRNNLPVINNNWKIGDYVLVNQDQTLDDAFDGVRPPSTMYVLLPGIVTEYKYHSSVRNSTKVPSALTGVELANDTIDSASGDVINTEDSEIFKTYFDLSSGYRGSPNVDYFKITYLQGEEYTCYYYNVAVSGNREYSNPFFVTGQIPLAQEDVIGGFYNVPDTALDGGYVYRDDTGHLRLLDYTLLRSGTLAYQLGEDFKCPSGVSHSEIQTNLDEYVNQRIAFPNNNQIKNAKHPNTINITIEPLEEEEQTVINIVDIDSRFNTNVYLHINGKATDKLTINIIDCQRIRIDSNIGGNPTINLYRSKLYYDASVIDRLNIIEDLGIWYEKFEDTDPNLLVDGMTIRNVDEPVIPDEIDYWNESNPNDIHLLYALHNITLSPDGNIVGCGLYVKNESTTNISQGKSIVSSKFTLPQGSGLIYPKNRLTKQIKITGSFITAYSTDVGYMTINTSFSALTNVVNKYDSSNNIDGVISFYLDANIVESVSGLPVGTSLDCWDSNSYNMFEGVAI